MVWNSWQVISPVEVVGYVVVVDELLAVQNKTYAQPTILVAKGVKGEEEIPEGTVAVLTPDMPDVLSHVSVRARNSKVKFQGFLFFLPSYMRCYHYKMQFLLLAGLLCYMFRSQYTVRPSSPKREVVTLKTNIR